MATLVNNNISNNLETVIVKTDLNADGGVQDFIYTGGRQVLVIENTEIAQITVNLLGDGVTATDCNGLPPLDLSAGFDVTIVFGETKTIYLDKARSYLGDVNNNVTLTVTGATGLSMGWLQA